MVTPRLLSTMNIWPTRSGGATVLAQEDLDDINSASSDSLSPDLGEMWLSAIIPDNISEEERSATSSTFSSEESFEYPRAQRVEFHVGCPVSTLRLVLCWEHSSTK